MEDDRSGRQPTLHRLGIEQLRSVRAGSTQVDGFRITPGALYEPGYIQNSIDQLRSGRDLVWYSLYLLIHEDRRHAVGCAGYHGEPINGRVEIGYEVAPTCRCRGLGTAAARLLTRQAFRDPAVREVFAESRVENTPSRRVLEKAGFQHLSQAMIEIHGLVDQWIIRRG